jgi:uncharacterized protein YaeQ
MAKAKFLDIHNKLRKMKKFVLFLVILLALLGCRKRKSLNIINEEPVAVVYKNYLYPSDLKRIIANTVNPADSAAKVSGYIDSWIKKQLILSKAELNLTDDEKDVENQLEDYRASLLIYKYKQNYIEQKLDTTIEDASIQGYYEQHPQDFKLINNVVKAIYIKIALQAPDVSKIKWAFRSSKENDMKFVQQYCKANAKVYDTFNEDWILFNDLLKELPAKINSQEDFLQRNKYIDAQDSAFLYLVQIKEFKLKNDISPLVFVHNNVKTILLNKKKLDLLNNLEKNIYEDAINQGVIRTFKE